MMGNMLREEKRLTRLRERIEDRPNDLKSTVQIAHLEYYLRLNNEAQRSIERALELGYEDDGSMQIRLARIHMRKHKVDTSSVKREVLAALEAFRAAFKNANVASKPVHYLEVASAYLKLNETQRAMKALATILIRWPHSDVATLAQEISAQLLLARGKPAEALPYYKALLIDSSAQWKFDLVDGDDYAEVDIPLARNVLGTESIFLQMGLCYENIGNMRVAKEAYFQAWNESIEQRKGELRRNHDAKASSKTCFNETILGKANTVLGMAHPGSGRRNANTAGSWDMLSSPVGSRGSASEDRCTPSPRGRKRSGGSPPRRSPSSEPPSFREHKRSSPSGSAPGPVQDQLLPRPVSGVSTGRWQPNSAQARKHGAAEAGEEMAQKLGFHLWLKEPYTWYRIGEDLVSGECFALALAFLDKTVGMLPPGLEQQEKEKHMPVFMRLRRKFGERELRTPHYFGLAQLRLLRTEAFFQLGVIPCLQGCFSDAHAEAEQVRALEPFEKAVRRLCPRLMALYRKDYALETQATVRIQRAWRGHRKLRVLVELVTRRREAIATLQAFHRGCQGRAALRSMLEKGYCDSQRGKFIGSYGDFDGDALGAFRGVNNELGCTRQSKSSTREHTITSIGRLTRHNLPMDAGYPNDFRLPNLSAFLWEGSSKENDDFNTTKVPSAASSASAGSVPCASTALDDGGVFEVSIRVFLPPHNGTGSVNHGRKRLPLTRPAWVPPAVAPEISLAQALDCSMLVINSPSFSSVSARRLFSRIGRPWTLATERRLAPPFSSKIVNGGVLIEHQRRGNTAPSAISGEYSKAPQRRVLGNRLEHIIILGHSPVGSAALSELSSAIRHGWLSRLSTLAIGGLGSRVGPRGIMSLARALSSAGCCSLRNLALSYCCLGQQSFRQPGRQPKKLFSPASNFSSSSLRSISEQNETTATAAANKAWNAFFRHLQRVPALSSLSVQHCGLVDGNMRDLSITVQILPIGRLRCLRLNGNCVGSPGLRTLLRALTSRRIRLPALWLRQQQPALVESQAREEIQIAFTDGLWAEVEFERPMEAMDERSRLPHLELTAESMGLGKHAVKHTTSNIYL